jgi:nucleoredoxin
MNRRLLAVFGFTAIGLCAALANALPLTAKDVGLMLRSGYSNASVTRELSKRHFVGGLDAASESGLIKAGASPELIAHLNDGTYALPAVDSAKAEQKMSDLVERRKADTEHSRTAQQQYQAQMERDRSKAATAQGTSKGTSNFLQGMLVRCHNGAVVPAEEDATATKKLFLFYFSAHWCVPCRKFTPQLVEYYNRTIEHHPEVEIVFYSFDRSANEMETYMREANMPWLALDYGRRQEKQSLVASAGEAIPALILADAAGNILSQTAVDGKYLGPQKVLADLDTILAGNAPRMAQGR